jgi:phosphorylated CTD-interacting factor 1
MVRLCVDDVCRKLAAGGESAARRITEAGHAEQSDAAPVLSERDGQCTLTFKDDTMRINRSHLDKLRVLHEAAGGHADTFVRDAYVVARRYATFIGSALEGAGYHGALPDPVFEALHDDFEVCQELFASPFNCYFSRYCSAFEDSDRAFGSEGSFFGFSPGEGSFEANPPFTEEVMLRMAERIDKLCGGSEGPLSFVVFVPQRRQPLSQALAMMV